MSEHHERHRRWYRRFGRFTLRHSLLLLAIVLGYIAFSLVRSVTWTVSETTQEPIVGGIAVLDHPVALKTPPIFMYFSTYANGSLSVQLMTGSTGASGHILMTNLDTKPCTATGMTITDGPNYVFDDTTASSIDQYFVRKVFAIGFTLGPETSGSLTCTTDTVPQADSFVTRRIAISPPLQRDLLASVPGTAITTEWASIERLPGSSDATFSGGERVNSSAFGALLEAREISGHDPIIRATWTETARVGERDFRLFLASLLVGLGATGLFEWLRSLLPNGVLGRG